MGTGIVFVVLVAIWAAYFLQYWSRRREHLATARSVEAFSEAMRVLERRPTLRASTGSRVSSAYAVSPARVVSARPAPRPQVMAKPVTPAPHDPRGGDLSMRMPTMPHLGARPAASGPSQARADGARPGGARRPSRPSDARSGSRPPARRSASSRGPRPSRQVRGLTFLALFAATLVTLVLAAAGILLWIAPGIAAVVTVAGFLWLRAGVQAEIRARRASRQPVRRSRPTGARRTGAGEAGAPVRRSAGHAHGVAQAGPVQDGQEHDVADLGGDDELRSSTTVVADADGAGTEDDAVEGPDGWSPVPVPPPTYTLKAKAERPAPAVEQELARSEIGEAVEAGAELSDQDAAHRAAYGT